MFIIKVSPDSRMRQQTRRQKGEEERHMALSPIPCWQAASPQTPFSLSSVRAADCSGPTSPSVSQACAPDNVAAMQFSSGPGAGEGEAAGSGGVGGGGGGDINNQ